MRADLFGDKSGQMNVELAVLVPIMLVVGLIAYNLSVFVALTATFDRAAANAIVSFGVSPSGYATEAAAITQIKSEVERALANDRCIVEVKAAPVYEDSPDTSAVVFPMSPLLTRYTVRMKYKTWPSAMSFAGTHFDPPFYLEHEKTLVVDRFRPGVVM